MANICILTGRLTADPELRQTDGNVPVASFRIAVPRRYKKDATDFINIVAWRKDAEFVHQYFIKGKLIEVIGSLQTREYTDKEGKKRTAFEVVAEQVSFVGDKPKEDGAPANGSAASPPPISLPAAPPGFDPFARAASQSPPVGCGNASKVFDFAVIDGDNDIPF